MPEPVQVLDPAPGAACPAPHGCELPGDCAFCERYQCNRCERIVPWEEGAADDTPGLCDDCAAWFHEGDNA